LYFDIFDYPLSEEQLYFFLFGEKTSRSQLKKVCRSVHLSPFIEKVDGYYCLKGKSWLVEHRKNSQKRATELWRMAERTASRIRHLPFVRGIYISGDLSKGVAGHDSDIDFFLITATDRVWLCKLFLAMFRRVPRYNPQKLLCFNYLISESYLELQEQNIYTAVEIAGLAPLYNLTLFTRFLQCNRWARDYFPQYHLAPDPSLCLFHGQSRWQFLLELPFRNPLANLLDRALQQLWYRAWKWRYRKEPATQRQLLSGIHRQCSKSHGYPTDTEIMQEYQKRLQQWNLD
ncbi:hypothetical protein JXO59_10635, partial [candidate division KSB1 bacterium]|nr:hypothetical protein [candidate division KSB1 bacterium]